MTDENKKKKRGTTKEGSASTEVRMPTCCLYVGRKTLLLEFRVDVLQEKKTWLVKVDLGVLILRTYET